MTFDDFFPTFKSSKSQIKSAQSQSIVKDFWLTFIDFSWLHLSQLKVTKKSLDFFIDCSWLPSMISFDFGLTF